ncbi:amidase [Intrasporangium sp.]|uniref:amidase n=1 Tax=Intrasporangium sp. TaxID=1925024 RepID=UPI00322162F1
MSLDPSTVPRPDDLTRIVDWSGAELSAAIAGGQVTCVEVMAAYLDHIDLVNPHVNAIVSLRPRDELLAEAAEKDARLARGERQGWMHGFPHAVKDLADVAGLPTTKGFYRPLESVPPATCDAGFVQRIRAAGAIFIGKTNTPELGLGSQTYNRVHGLTRNPYDLTRTPGGSSGGAAAAVALRLLPVADGSDFMGSLRNPPGWTNVYGLRPSFGRVPAGEGELFVDQGSVAGPIARTPLDLALLLGTMSGYAAQAPLSLDGPGLDVAACCRPLAGGRVLWLRDLGGYLPMEPEVLEICDAAVERLAGLGFEVTFRDELPAHGGFRGTDDLWELWRTYRHVLAGGAIRPLYEDPRTRAMLKPEAVYEVDGLLHGLAGAGPITAADLLAASARRSDLYRGFLGLFETTDFVLLPTAQVMPFDVRTPWPEQVAGRPMSSYHRWMEVATIGTLLGAPTLAMPAGFGPSGLPVGLQVIGPNHADTAVLRLAATWHAATRWPERRRPKLLTGGRSV